jgi:hypothetical protein
MELAQTASAPVCTFPLAVSNRSSGSSWHGLKLAQIGQQLERTPAAVEGLLERG